MFQNEENKKSLKENWIADDPLPHKLEVSGTVVSLEVRPKGCWNITDKTQLIVCIY